MRDLEALCDPHLPAHPLEHDAVALRTQLAARDDELRQLLHVISHDLRAPLRAVAGFAGLLETDAPDLSGEARDYLHQVLANVREAQAMLGDLDDYARAARRCLALQTVDPAASIELACAALRAEIDRSRAEIHVMELAPVVGDPQRLVEVWRHLLSNALKFSHRSPRIMISCVASAGGVEFRIDDEGIGIPACERERVFGLFVRLHHVDVFPGRGAGLSLVRRLVEAQAGRVWIEASIPEGWSTRVCFSLAATR